MNRYDPRTPRTLLGLLAAAICTATLAVAVVLPAETKPASFDDDIVTRVTSECTGEAGRVVSIDVVAARAATMAQSHPAVRPIAG